MIISCNSCKKKFDVDSDLIPDDGRLLECSKCNNVWFYKNVKKKDESTVPIKEIKELIYNDVEKKIPNSDVIIKDITNELNLKHEKSIINKTVSRNVKNQKMNLSLDPSSQSIPSEKVIKVKNNFLKLIILFIITIIALIILADTLKKPIGFFIPNIELILYNLYETLKDIMSFFSDLF